MKMMKEKNKMMSVTALITTAICNFQLTYSTEALLFQLHLNAFY